MITPYPIMFPLFRKAKKIFDVCDLDLVSTQAGVDLGVCDFICAPPLLSQ